MSDHKELAEKFFFKKEQESIDLSSRPTEDSR